MAKKIRVLIADDHAIVREGVRSILSKEPDIELVAEAIDGVQAVTRAKALKPDIILLDVVMPRMDGWQAITEIKKTWPAGRIIMLSSYINDGKVLAALRSGAEGFLTKDCSPRELVDAILTVSQGAGFISPTIASKILREINQPSKIPPARAPLTQREADILKLLAQGLTNSEIAAKFVVSERTVRTHVSNILAKLHLANRTQAVLYALREGIAELDAGDDSCREEDFLERHNQGMPTVIG